MDNNLTNIDDLFKQRLGNAEEAGRPGSWLKMKDLLDEQMPAGTVPAAATGNKRKIGFAALLLLLSAVTIGGGYELYSSFRGNAVSSDTIALYASQEAGTGIASAVVNYADEKIAQPYNEFNNTDNNDIPNTTSGGAIVGVGKNTSKSTISAATQNGVTASTAVTKRNNSEDIAAVDGNGKPLSNSDLVVVTESESVINENVTKNDKPRQISSATTQTKAVDATATALVKKADAASIVKQESATSSTRSRDVDELPMSSGDMPRMNNTGGKTLPSGVEKDLNPVANTNRGNKPSDNKVAESFNLDTFKKIEMKERVAIGGKVLRDTTSIGNVVVKSNKPSIEKPVDNTALAMNAKKEQQKALPEELLLQAQQADLQTEDGEGVYTDLSKKKVSSHKMKNYNGQRFEEMVRNAKFKMKSIKFYPGLVAGVNSSFSPSISGFQLGFVGDVSLGDKWSVLTELKYMQRFNNSVDFKEHYFDNLDSSYNSTGGKVYTFDSVQNSYNFSTLGSFEMPIAIRYSFKKFNLFGGANLAYNLSVSVDKTYLPNQITQEGATGYTPDYTKMAGAPSVMVSDFTNRFTVGYLLGVSYNWSPSMRLDMRLTQAVWDNAKTNGENTISKDLYRKPNVQLNLSYRFGKKPYKRLSAK